MAWRLSVIPGTHGGVGPWGGYDPLMVGSFVIVYYGNTGSSWLVQTLGSAPGVLIPAFEPLESWAWKAEGAEKLAWLRTAFSPPAVRVGPEFDVWVAALGKSPQFSQLPTDEFSTVGFKMTWSAVPDTAALLEFFREKRTMLVFLERSNRIKHALSLYRYHDEKKSQFELAGVRPPSKVKLKRFDYWVQDSIRLHGELDAFRATALDSLDPESITTVAYEDFVSPEGKVAVIDRLVEFLGIEAPSLDASHFEKSTPDDLRSAIVNYDRLRRRYRKTPLAEHFED
jgi:LPS sulfotransferase NodH